jgi:hypothetical protein
MSPSVSRDRPSPEAVEWLTEKLSNGPTSDLFVPEAQALVDARIHFLSYFTELNPAGSIAIAYTEAINLTRQGHRLCDTILAQFEAIQGIRFRNKGELLTLASLSLNAQDQTVVAAGKVSPEFAEEVRILRARALQAMLDDEVRLGAAHQGESATQSFLDSVAHDDSNFSREEAEIVVAAIDVRGDIIELVTIPIWLAALRCLLMRAIFYDIVSKKDPGLQPIPLHNVILQIAKEFIGFGLSQIAPITDVINLSQRVVKLSDRERLIREKRANAIQVEQFVAEHNEIMCLWTAQISRVLTVYEGSVNNLQKIVMTQEDISNY